MFCCMCAKLQVFNHSLHSSCNWKVHGGTIKWLLPHMEKIEKLCFQDMMSMGTSVFYLKCPQWQLPLCTTRPPLAITEGQLRKFLLCGYMLIMQALRTSKANRSCSALITSWATELTLLTLTVFNNIIYKFAGAVNKTLCFNNFQMAVQRKSLTSMYMLANQFKNHYILLYASDWHFVTTSNNKGH